MIVASRASSSSSGGRIAGDRRGEHRLARAGRPDEDEPVAAGEGDLEGPPRLEQAAHVGEVGRLGRRRRRRPRPPTSSGTSSVRMPGPVPADAAAAQRRRRPRPATPTPTTSMPGTRRASATRVRRARRPGRRPRRARAATIGRSPGTGRTSPPRPSSPSSAHGPRGRTCSEPTRIAIAIPRSSAEPAFGTSAGARLTVMRRGGWTNPLLRSAPRTRSRASRRAASARPTIVKPGQPGRDVDLDPDGPAVEAVERGGKDAGEHGPHGSRRALTGRLPALIRRRRPSGARAGAARRADAASADAGASGRRRARRRSRRPCRWRGRSRGASARAASRPS